MVYYEYVIVLRKTKPQTNENHLVHTLFQKKSYNSLKKRLIGEVHIQDLTRQI